MEVRVGRVLLVIGFCLVPIVSLAQDRIEQLLMNQTRTLEILQQQSITQEKMVQLLQELKADRETVRILAQRRGEDTARSLNSIEDAQQLGRDEYAVPRSYFFAFVVSLLAAAGIPIFVGKMQLQSRALTNSLLTDIKRNVSANGGK